MAASTLSVEKTWRRRAHSSRRCGNWTCSAGGGQSLLVRVEVASRIICRHYRCRWRAVRSRTDLPVRLFTVVTTYFFVLTLNVHCKLLFHIHSGCWVVGNLLNQYNFAIAVHACVYRHPKHVQLHHVRLHLRRRFFHQVGSINFIFPC